MQGLVESLNKRIHGAFDSLYRGLPAFVKEKYWPFLLPAVQRKLNTTIHLSTGYTPFEAFKGYPAMPNDGILGLGVIPLWLVT